MPTWRSEFRAAITATNNGELDESIVRGIAGGIAFIKQVETAKSTKLGWGTYAATSHMAYAKGDPNPWGKCEGILDDRGVQLFLGEESPKAGHVGA